MDPHAELHTALVLISCHIGMAVTIAFAALANLVGWW